MSGVRVHRIVALIAGLLVACTPLVGDLCANSCDQPAEQTCPQHAPKPAPRCAHDHGTMNADVPRHAPAGGRAVQPAVGVTIAVFADQTAITTPVVPAFGSSPPRSSGPLVTLRI